MRGLPYSLAVCLALSPAVSYAQSTVIQGGPWSVGHVPMYAGPGGSTAWQPVVQDSGTAAGGAIGVGLSELGLTVRGVGTGPFPNGGTGPYGANFCDYDGPTTSANGYHYVCLSPNAQGSGLLEYGSGGGAAPLPFTIMANGQIVTLPTNGYLSGPNASAVGDVACWNNSTGTVLKDCGTVLNNIAPLSISNAYLTNSVITFGGQVVGLGGSAAVRGNGPRIQLSTGSYASFNCLEFDVFGNAVDFGAPCATIPPATGELLGGSGFIGTASPVAIGTGLQLSGGYLTNTNSIPPASGDLLGGSGTSGTASAVVVGTGLSLIAGTLFSTITQATIPADATKLLGGSGTPNQAADVSLGAGLSLTSGTLFSTITQATIPSDGSKLLSGSGTANQAASVTVGTGLSFAAGTLASTITQVEVPAASGELLGGSGISGTASAVAIGAGLNLSGGALSSTITQVTVPPGAGQLLGGTGVAGTASTVNVGAGLSLSGSSLTNTITQTTVPPASGEVLVGSGTPNLAASASIGANLSLSGGALSVTIPHGLVAVTSSGTWTVPAGVYSYTVTLCGGGGGGGGGTASYGAAGGGAGGWNRGVITTTPGTSVSITIGSSGSGSGAGVDGSAGATTTVGSLRATGGEGGTYATVGSTAEPGIGGVALGGPLDTIPTGANSYTCTTGPYMSSQGFGTCGGSSQFGQGGIETGAAGSNAYGYCAGGGGGSAGSYPGGNGSPGLAWIEY
jgi:hypothetical protein